MDSFLRGTNQCLDQILDVPAEKWGDREIQLYNLLQQQVDKYKSRYCSVQFRLDKEDIQKNVCNQQWYLDSRYQKALDWYLEQLDIQSYSHSNRTHHYKVTASFVKVKVNVTIYHTEKLQIILESDQLKCDLSRPDKIAELFNLTSQQISEKDRKQLVQALISLITEIALFYQD